jgi:hypothetical protein
MLQHAGYVATLLLFLHAGCYAAAMAFMNGPDYNVITGEGARHCTYCGTAAGYPTILMQQHATLFTACSTWRSNAAIDSSRELHCALA